MTDEPFYDRLMEKSEIQVNKPQTSETWCTPARSETKQIVTRRAKDN